MAECEITASSPSQKEGAQLHIISFWVNSSVESCLQKAKSALNKRISNAIPSLVEGKEGDSIRNDEEDLFERERVSSEDHHQGSNFGLSPPSLRQKSTGCQTKEKGNKTSSSSSSSIKSSSTPVGTPHYDVMVYQPAGPVYQPAGPLIDCGNNKTSPMPVPLGILDASLQKLPPDLKVTYHPPSLLPPTNSSLMTSKASGSGGKKHSSSSSTSHHHHHQKEPKSENNSTSSRKSSHHQFRQSSEVPSSQSVPYKPYLSPSTAASSTISSSAPSSLTTSSAMPRVIHPNYGGLGNMYSTNSASGVMAIPNTNPTMPSIPSVTSGGAPSAGLYYTGYGPTQSSPFAPCKFPMVPPDNYRTHSPYQSPMYPGSPQQSTQPASYFMTPFYTPPITPTVAQTQGRLLAPLHPSAAAAYYQSATTTTVPSPLPPIPPAAHHPNYFAVASPPQLQPSHHSTGSQLPAGHAGRSVSRQQSSPLCPTDSYLPNTNSNNTKSSNNNKRPQQQQSNFNNINSSNKRRMPASALLQAHPTTHPVAAAAAKQPPVIRPNQKNNKDHLPPTCITPALGADPPKTPLSNQNTFVDRQLESAKTFTEQYSLPDDITITILVGSDGKQANKKTEKSGPAKQKDVVHVIDPRTGDKTTIAKHMSNTNLNSNISQGTNKSINKIVTQVKPNNAGNVARICNNLDVIIISGGKNNNNNKNSSEVKQHQQQPKKDASQSINKSAQYINNFKFNNNNSSNNNNNNQRVSLSNSNKFGQNNNNKNNTNIVHPSSVNLVSPLPKAQNNMTYNKKSYSENSSIGGGGKGHKRSLIECIDGLQKKKMRILEDQNKEKSILSDISSTQIGQKSQNLEKQQIYRVETPNLPITMSSARSRTLDMDRNRTNIINCNEAVVAASAVVQFPQNIRRNFFLDPQKNGLLKSGQYGRTASPKVMEKTIVTAKGSRTKPLIKSKGKATATSGRIVHKGKIQEIPRGRLIRRVTKKRSGESDSSRSSSGVRSTTVSQRTSPNYLSLGGGSRSNTIRIPGGSSEQSRPKNSDTLFDYFSNRSSIAIRHQGYPFSAGFNNANNNNNGNNNKSQSSCGSMAANALKKRAVVKPLSPFDPMIINGALHNVNRNPVPKWSNGWRFEGQPFSQKIYLANDEQPVARICYPAMRHDGGDLIQTRDCVLLKSGPKKNDLPFVAKIAALWENPLDGEMMFSLLWYYRPEHTEFGRSNEDMPDEIFASKHRDCNSVATIEDRCYVLTFNEYCRYKKRLKQLTEGINGVSSTPVVPSSKSTLTNANHAANIAMAVWAGGISKDPQQQQQQQPPPPQQQQQQKSSTKISPEVIFFCRKVYEYRSKKILKNPS